MSPLLQRFLFDLLRFAMAPVMVFMIDKGIVTAEHGNEYLLAGIAAIIGLAFTLWSRYKDRLTFLAAKSLPAGASGAQITAKAQSPEIKEKAFQTNTDAGRIVAVLLAVGLFTSACATVDGFNRTSAQLVSQAITASEVARCGQGITPPACLNPEQFKAVNQRLYQVSVAGERFTQLRIEGKDNLSDLTTFIGIVSRETGEISTAFPKASAGATKVLGKLAELQQKAAALLDKYVGGN
jgi:hypothetical protein